MENKCLRMCLVCRKMQPKNQMVRVVKNKDNNISIDLTSKQDGRGAYICLNEDCVNNFKKSKCLNRAFKCEVKPEVYDSLLEELNAKSKHIKN